MGDCLGPSLVWTLLKAFCLSYWFSPSWLSKGRLVWLFWGGGCHVTFSSDSKCFPARDLYLVDGFLLQFLFL